jgi:hypothetical protein
MFGLDTVCFMNQPLIKGASEILSYLVGLFFFLVILGEERCQMAGPGPIHGPMIGYVEMFLSWRRVKLTD